MYSGVSANGNGNSNDDTNLDATFLRGLQKTGQDGVVQFESIFPGHYTGRTTHIHGTTSPTPSTPSSSRATPMHAPRTTLTKSATQTTVLSHALNTTTVNVNNNTLAGLYTAHSAYVGQIFFDQELISTVEETSPYSTNTQELTTNAEDSILAEEADTIDPFVEYVFLGEDVSDGIFAWISLGMDATADKEVNIAAYLTEDGGVENENSGMGGGPGGEMPSGAPSGVPPSS